MFQAIAPDCQRLDGFSMAESSPRQVKSGGRRARVQNWVRRPPMGWWPRGWGGRWACFLIGLGLMLGMGYPLGIWASEGVPLAPPPWETLPVEPVAVDPTDALTPVVLQLKWKHQFQFAGYYAAQQQGFYEDAGLAVTIMEAPDDGSPPVQRVLQGQADFGVATSDLLLLRSMGQPVVALAAIFQHSPLVFLSLPTSGISTVHDLAGRRIMLEAHAEELLAYLQAESVPTAGITFLPHTFAPEDLIRGRVDAMSAYSTDEPFQLYEQGLAYSIFTPRSAGIDFYGDTLFTTEAYLQAHPDQAKRFLEASLQGWSYAMAHPEEIIDLIYGDYSQRHSRAHLAFEAERMKPLVMDDLVELGYMHPGRWRHIADTYAKLGMVAPGLALDGFIYDRNPRPDLTWVYRALSAAAVLLILALWVATRFYRLHRRIAQEMAETERIAANLAALEQQYRVMVECAPFSIVITHYTDGTVFYINPKAAQTFGIHQDYVKGKPVVNYYVHPDDRDCFLQVLGQQGFVQNWEVMLQTALGHPFWASLSATLIDFGQQPAIFTALLDVSDRKQMETQLQQMAMTDELTGLFNRRHFTRQGEQTLNLSPRSPVPCALIMLDVDHFKAINDTHGHQAGDDVLKTIAKVLGRNIRDADTVGRLGGEEFAILLPSTPLFDAAALAERLRQSIETIACVVQGQAITLTISLGVASPLTPTDTLDTLLSRADQAMYAAKHQGRNRVMMATPTGIIPYLSSQASA